MEIGIFTMQIGLALVSGLLMGLEREYKGKSAGLKTQGLVALGACTFVSLSMNYAGEEYVDMTRVLSQVVIGIGFLGGGVILQKGNKIKGLTTAATVWCAAAAGCLAGTQMYAELVVLTAFVVVVNLVFGWIDSKVGEVG